MTGDLRLFGRNMIGVDDEGDFEVVRRPSRLYAVCLVVADGGGLALSGTGAGAVAGRQRIIVRATEFVPAVTAHLDALFAQLSRTGALPFLCHFCVVDLHSDEAVRVLRSWTRDDRRRDP